MKRQTAVRAAASGAPKSGPKSAWVAAFCLALSLCAGGCASVGQAFTEKAPETTVLAGEVPANYGVVVKVGSADMAGKELRKGDLAVTVELDNGGLIMLIQPQDDIYTVGDRVRIFRDNAGFVRAQLL